LRPVAASRSNPELANIRILAVTGVYNSEKSRLVLESCDAFIEKPYEIPDLVSAVRQLAGS
jgi:CheY-like chemotaxis protein